MEFTIWFSSSGESSFGILEFDRFTDDAQV